MRVSRSSGLLVASLVLASLVLLVSGSAAAASQCRSELPPREPASPFSRFAPPAEMVIACVGQRAVTGAQFVHRFRIERKVDEQIARRLRPARLAGLRYGVDLLIRSDWYLGEARRLGITVTAGRVSRELRRLRRAQFKTKQGFRRFLRLTGETVADVRFSLRLILIYKRLLRHFAPSGKPSADTLQRRLDRVLTRAWKPITYCRAQYAISDCGHTT